MPERASPVAKSVHVPPTPNLRCNFTVPGIVWVTFHVMLLEVKWTSPKSATTDRDATGVVTVTGICDEEVCLPVS